MKKSVYKIIISSILILCFIVAAFAVVTIAGSERIAVLQAKKSMEYLAQKYANEFNVKFMHMESMVKTMGSIAESEFSVEQYRNDRQEFESRFYNCEKIAEKVVRDSIYPVGLYLTFDINSSGGRDEIWYVKAEDGKVLRFDSLSVSDRWLEEGTEEGEYYFKAIEDGEYWSEPQYDLGMDRYVISYSEAIYDERDMLIGVAGADIVVDDIFESLSVIDNEIDGVSALYGRKGQIISGTEDINNLDKDKYIKAEAKIADKWTIGLAQPINVASEPINQMKAVTVILAILIIVLGIMVIVSLSRRKVQPIITEVEQKNLIMINQERQAKMGGMIGNVAHQWKQPLNNMKMALLNMEEDFEGSQLTDEDFRQYVEKIKMMIQNLAETIGDFTDFLKPARGKEWFSVEKEVIKVFNLMEEQIKLNEIRTEIKGEDLSIKGYVNEFDQCLINLIDNAKDALIERDGLERKIVVSIVRKRDRYENSSAVVIVFNNGGGISEKDGEGIFDLYFTTKADKNGTGIGLYLTKQIIEEHFNGKIFYSNIDDGVEFTMEIPINEEERGIHGIDDES